MDVILRANNCDRAKAGDRVSFVGSLVVCPDVSALYSPGQGVSIRQGEARARALALDGGSWPQQLAAALRVALAAASAARLQAQRCLQPAGARLTASS